MIIKFLYFHFHVLDVFAVIYVYFMAVYFILKLIGARKSLLNVFQDGNCHPKMAMVIDDRLKVWDDKDQPRVHVVPAFAPYYAPQAEVLCLAFVLFYFYEILHILLFLLLALLLT